MKNKPSPFMRQQYIVTGNICAASFCSWVSSFVKKTQVTGFIQPTPIHIHIELQGSRDEVQACSQKIQQYCVEQMAFAHERILPLRDEEPAFAHCACVMAGEKIGIQPDKGICLQCAQDIFDTHNRKNTYPFTSCHNCGPRYSITQIPYIKAHTSMSCFEMCPQCTLEQTTDFIDTSSHFMQTETKNCCPQCGPSVWFVQPDPNDIMPEYGGKLPDTHNGDNLTHIERLVDFLLEGGIAAVKGLGGFHLTCLAADSIAITMLRQRKNRPHKPLAVMAPSLAEVKKFAKIQEEEEKLLTLAERPIVICPAIENNLSPSIAPSLSSIGVMLPYTPLHYILFDVLQKKLQQKNDSRPPVLIMTSGNKSGEPICLGNREAMQRLYPMVGAFLLHNRDILMRVDDSVVRPAKDGCIILRRARGFVPIFLPLPVNGSSNVEKKTVLAVGADLKNTICLTKIFGEDACALVSQHIGDMDNVANEVFQEKVQAHFEQVLSVQPEIIVCDAHPQYRSSQIASDLAKARNLPLYILQHHAAHAFSVLGENLFFGKALVLTLDGTGYGKGDTLWGGEALLVDTTTGKHARVGTCMPIPLPGGEVAIKQPWRIAHGLMHLLGISIDKAPWLSENHNVAQHIGLMLDRNINTIYSSSCGRLFDAVAALLGICTRVTYEGQAAIMLEDVATNHSGTFPALHCPIIQKDKLAVLDTYTLFTLVAQQKNTLAASARAFHESLINGFVALAVQLCEKHKLSHVGLTGGCFNNALLRNGLYTRLQHNGITPLVHTNLPPGDGNIAYGQAVWASLALKKQ